MGTQACGVLQESKVPGIGGSVRGCISFQAFNHCHPPISTTFYLIFSLDSIQNSLKF